MGDDRESLFFKQMAHRWTRKIRNGPKLVHARPVTQARTRGFLETGVRSSVYVIHPHFVYQLCTVIEDLGMDVFRDESGAFIPSRSYNEGEQNLGVARRFLERQNCDPDAAGNSRHAG